MQSALEDISFRDPARALPEVSALTGAIPAAYHPKLKFLLTASADPDAAVHYLGRMRQEHGDAFLELIDDDPALHYLIVVFSYSRFLSEEVLQHPGWIDELINSDDMYRVRSSEEYRSRLISWLGPAEDAPTAVGLARFRRHELLRILLRDVLGHATLSDVAEELSNLADAILHVTYRRIRGDLARRFGNPMYKSADGRTRECGFSIIALGKLGGRELNYSSDIDLMFVYTANGETNGPSSITNKEFFKRVANQCTDLLSTYTAEGMCYRVDLRLRPDGSLGEIGLSLDGCRAYYTGRARDWELQMLIKARVAAGEPEPGRDLLESVEPRIYSTTLDFSAVESVSLTRERIHEKLASKRGGDTGEDVKLTRGGIRDIEFLTQCLQRLHGGREPWVRHGGTLQALLRLADKDLLSEIEYSRLAGAYQFLRNIEHRLQVLEDRQTHVLPQRSEDLEVLARRMPLPSLGGVQTADHLLQELNRHLEDVQETYNRVIHSQQPLYYTLAPTVPIDDTPEPPLPSPVASSNLVRFLDQRAPALAREIANSQLRRGFQNFELFLESLLPNARLLKLMDQNPQLTADAIDLFENSPYYAEELIRTPALVEEVDRARDGQVHDFPAGLEMLSNAVDLRRYFRRQMLRIQTKSVCLHREIFETLGRTSDLADAVIAAAYGMAVAEVKESAKPAPVSEPHDQMMVIALGRLGMREFDLGSDADLNFVLPDGTGADMQFWTRVARRLIDILTAYTGEGVLFSVDTRLRPNGREGPLVQTVSRYLDYFAGKAEAWEGISYMKSRAVAGNIEAGTKFLNQLQEVDWRRYGQSGRSRANLRDMRIRLESEQGETNPLKAGFGGYYDIDFALMFLRLRAAGIFFKVLNTPERIDVIERMGHLDPEDAKLLRDAAILYRAIDHGLRVYSGHAEGRLPKSEVHLRTLTALVRRWTPEHLHDQPLPVELAQIQTGTRQFFKRLFS